MVESPPEWRRGRRSARRRRRSRTRRGAPRDHSHRRPPYRPRRGASRGRRRLPHRPRRARRLGLRPRGAGRGARGRGGPLRADDRDAQLGGRGGQQPLRQRVRRAEARVRARPLRAARAGQPRRPRPGPDPVAGERLVLGRGLHGAAGHGARGRALVRRRAPHARRRRLHVHAPQGRPRAEPRPPPVRGRPRRGAGRRRDVRERPVRQPHEGDQHVRRARARVGRPPRRRAPGGPERRPRRHGPVRPGGVRARRRHPHGPGRLLGRTPRRPRAAVRRVPGQRLAHGGVRERRGAVGLGVHPRLREGLPRRRPRPPPPVRPDRSGDRRALPQHAGAAVRRRRRAARAERRARSREHLELRHLRRLAGAARPGCRCRPATRSSLPSSPTGPSRSTSPVPPRSSRTRATSWWTASSRTRRARPSRSR